MNTSTTAETSHKRTSGDVRASLAEKHRCDPVFACPSIQVTEGDVSNNSAWRRGSQDPGATVLWRDLSLLRQSRSWRRTIRAIQAFRARYPETSGIFIENRANGAAINTLERQTPGMNKVSPSKSKYDRAFASSDELNAGNWYLPHPQIAPWVDAFLVELSAFPRGKHDDWIDSWTQAREVLSGAGVPEYSIFTAAVRVSPFQIDPPGLRPWWDP